jgi:hypothetical protein
MKVSDSQCSVKNIIKCWETGGINSVKAFLSEVPVYIDTWPDKIKKLLENGHDKSVEEEISLVAFNINLQNKLYKDDEYQ